MRFEFSSIYFPAHCPQSKVGLQASFGLTGRNMASPKSWKKYHEKAKIHGHSKLEPLSRFQARYSLTNSLRKLSIKDASAEMSDSYLQIIRVTMAYSALEILENAISARNQIKIVDDKLAAELRKPSNQKLLEDLHKSIKGKESSKLHKSLQNFIDAESEDLRPVVYAIRNLFSHGTLSANRLRLLQSKSRRKLLENLADTTLIACDVRFNKYVKKIGE